MTARRILAAAGLLVILAAPAPQAKVGTTVPFDMLPSNHMVVEAKVDGKGPYRFIFDLGAPVTLLSNKAAEESGVVGPDAPRAFLFGMRGEAKVDKLQLGDLTARDVPVIVLDHPAVKALGGVLGRPLHGIIGYTFFARYRTTIDYQARQMTFVPVKFEPRDLMKDLPDRLTGPRVAKTRVLAPRGLWGLTIGAPTGGVSSPGVPITAVLEGSPAADAGLKPGDVLTSLDGRWTTSVADTYEAAASAPAGKPVEVVVLRDGQETSLTVTPGEGI